MEILALRARVRVVMWLSNEINFWFHKFSLILQLQYVVTETILEKGLFLLLRSP